MARKLAFESCETPTTSERFKTEKVGGEGAGMQQAEAPRDWDFHLLEVCLFLADTDPFELFKDPEERAHVQRKLGLESTDATFRMEFSERDRLRSRIARYNRILTCYLTLKGALVSVVKFLLLQHELYATAHTQHGVSVGREQGAPLFGANFLRAIINFTGNPLAALGEQSYYIYIGMTGVALNRLVLCPCYVRSFKRKLDMSNLRFMLKPSLELTRLDASIRKHLCELQQSIGCIVSNRLAQAEDLRLREWAAAHGSQNNATGRSDLFMMRRFLPRHSNVGVTSAESHQPLRAREQLENQVRALKESRDGGLATLRPRTFKLDWLSQERWLTRLTAVTFVSICHLTTLAHIALVLYLLMRAGQNCVASKPLLLTSAAAGQDYVNHESSRCLVFTWSDFVYSIELLFCLTCCSFAETAHTTSFYVNITNQIELINSMHGELDECARQLASYYRKLLVRVASAASAIDRLAKKRDNLLLKQIARLHIIESELVDGFRVLSRQVVQYFFHIVVAASILPETTSGSGGAIRPTAISVTPGVRTALLASLLLWQNIIALLCCAVNTRLVKLDKRHWSILAQITQIQLVAHVPGRDPSTYCASYGQSQATNFAGFGRGEPLIGTITESSAPQPPYDLDALDILKELWRKFAIVTSINIEQYCVRPLGIPLTLHRLMQFDFMVVFIYSLALNYTGSGSISG